MDVTHVGFEPGPPGPRLRLHVRSLPRTARDWEDAAVAVARVVVLLAGTTGGAYVVDRAEPGRADELLVGPFETSGPPLPTPDGGPFDARRELRRVVRLTVEATEGDRYGLPARLTVTPVALGGPWADGSDDPVGPRPHLRELVDPWWCVVDPPTGAPGAVAGARIGDRDSVRLERLARSRSVRARLAVAADPTAPGDLLGRLAADPSPAVRRAVAGNRGAPATVLELLVSDPVRRVRETLVENEAATPALLLRLLADPAWQVSWSVPDHPAADGSVLRAAAVHPDPVVRHLLASRPDVPADVTRVLLEDGEREVREHLAAFTADAAALAVLTRDANPGVRARASENELLTAEQVARLAADRSALVRTCLVQNRPDLPLEVRERLARDRAVPVRLALAEHRQPPSVQRVLVDDADEHVRARARARRREFRA